jgi:hypothetical protein
MGYWEQEHIARCKEDHENWEDVVGEWDCEWPDYCRGCNGVGQFITSYDPAPDVPGAGMLEMGEPCGDCTGAWPMLCPRCGRKWAYEDCDDYEDIIDRAVSKELPCPHCGWNWAKTEGDWRPKEPECHCWYLLGIDEER